MDCNKDEAVRAKEIAEKKMEKNDFEGARKIALKAQTLYPDLENISQILSICDVYCSAQKRLLGSEKDWYGILQVEKLADELTVKKQYRRLALILHPDKNRFPGAEGAFKLICEANALLSDTAKKSLYDNKISVLTGSAPANPSNHHINRSSQLNKQYGAQNTIANGFSNLNQHQATRSASSNSFWTCCPFCKVRYQYLRQYINKSLHCPTCSKIFMTYEVSAQGVSSVSNLGRQGAQHVPSKPDARQPAVFQEKVVQNPANFKMGVQNAKGSSVSHNGSERTANGESIQPESGVQTGRGSERNKVASAAGNLKIKVTDNHNLNTSSLHGRKEGMAFDSDSTYRERRDVKNKSRKKGNKLVVESSDSSDTDMTMQGNFGDPATDLKSESSHTHFIRRSSRKRQNVSYKETDEDYHARASKRAQATKEDERKEHKDAVESEYSEHGNQNNFPTVAGYCDPVDREMRTAHSKESLKNMDAVCSKEGKARGVTSSKSDAGNDTVEIESDSEGDISSCKNAEANLFLCPDPEFSDFDKVRNESNFKVNQFWACYDTLDGMPRFYAKVRHVHTSPFELHITWLEADPVDKAHEKWVDEELPAGCGSFKFGQTDTTSERLSFSHQVHCEKGKKRGSLTIYPRKGEVWALFKDWSMSWSTNPENYKEFKYEIVEVVSDFDTSIGIRVVYLDKVTGFVSLFQRSSQSETSSFLVGSHELYKFSHVVPFFRMTGTERKGVPVGSFELDPASLPLNPDDLYYPSKAKTERRHMDVEVNGSLPKYAEKMSKSVAPEGTCTPQKIVDLEGIKGDMSKLQRSPRGVNVIRKNTN